MGQLFSLTFSRKYANYGIERAGNRESGKARKPENEIVKKRE